MDDIIIPKIGRIKARINVTTPIPKDIPNFHGSIVSPLEYLPYCKLDTVLLN